MGTYQSKYTGQEIDNGINPVGTIISFMGTIAPEGFLICDGSELNIADFGNLAAHFETQFGSKNHFGGDGETTFALPDLRNEFLRGYHNGAEKQLSGEVGEHQEATSFTNLTSKTTYLYFASEHATTNYDNEIVGRDALRKVTGTQDSGASATGVLAHTVRPTNIAVLFCIKY